MRIVVAGASGEVGASQASALRLGGHDIVEVSARAPLPDEPQVVGPVMAGDLIREGSVDLVINASGRGDRRKGEWHGLQTTELLAAACGAAGIPGVLLSTTRVLEGYETDYSEAAPPLTRSDYAAANALNEQQWLKGGGSSVLRITNYFTPPARADSPQSRLLPWSLVTEATSSHQIRLRSGPSAVKEFVSAADVAAAVLLVAGSPQPVVATAPGAAFSLLDLARAAAAGVVAAGYAAPSLSFGPDAPAGPVCRPGWLASQGWAGELSLSEVTNQVAEWVLRAR